MVRKLMATTLLVSQIFPIGGIGGVAMANKQEIAQKTGETLTQAQAQDLMATIKGQIETAKNYAAGLPGATNPQSALIASLRKLNDGVRTYNPNKDAKGTGIDYIKIPAADATLSIAALDEIWGQVVIAANAPSTAGLAGMVATTSAPAESATVVPRKVGAAEAVPVPIVAVQQLSEEERSRYQVIADNLDLIYNYSTSKTGKAAAKELRDKITACMGYFETAEEASANRAKLKTYAAQYENSKAMTGALKSAQEAALAKAAKDAGITVKEAPKHPLQQKLVNIQMLLQRIPQGDERRQLADQAINMLPNVWLLGEETQAGGKDNMGTGPRWEMYAYLNAAMKTLTELKPTGDKTLAETSYGYAVNLFKQEQKLLSKRIGVLKAEVDNAVAAIRASSLPTGSQLLEQEKAQGVNAKDENNRFYRTSGRKIHNGREDIEAAMANRQAQVSKLYDNKGALSYQQVSDLEQTVRAEADAARTLIALWGYAAANGLDKADASEKKNAWKHYGAAAATLADPDATTAINPYLSYPAEMRKFLVDQYRKATGDSKASEAKIIAALMRSPQWRYDDALYGVWQHVYLLAAEPVVADRGTLQQMESIASLRAARVLYEDGYEQYVTLENRDADQRLEDARFFLQNATELVRKSGADEKDILLVSADRWAQMEAPADKAGKEEVAEYMYNMAVNMAAIREAELWITAQETLGGDAEAVKRASAAVKAAKTEFTWYFSVPQAHEAYYPNLPRNVADDAIRLAAPAGLDITDKNARYAALFWSAQAKEKEIALRTGDKAASAADLRKAQVEDRPTAIAAAQQAEKGHVWLLLDAMGNKDFARAQPAAGIEAYAYVHPNVGRRPIAIEAGRKRLNRERPDMHFDHEQVPHEQAAVYPHGSYYQAMDAEKALKGDKNAPALLRNLDLVKLNGIDSISRGYADEDTSHQQIDAANKAYVKLLDARIAELEARLAGEAVYDGKKVPIRLFARSEDPRGYIVVAAQEALAEAKKLRAQYNGAASIGTDLFNGSMSQNPREAVMMTEIALASLSDENFNFKPGKELTATFAVASDEEALTYKRAGGTPERVIASVNKVVVNEGGRAYSLEAYERKHGKQPLNYTFFWYRDLGGDQLLMNPAHDPNIADVAHQRYSGIVVRDATLSDGTKAGDVVVRVRKSRDATTADGVRWRPITDRNGNIPAGEVLYRLEGGTLNPVRDGTLTRNLDEVCTIRSIPKDGVIGVESARALVMVAPAKRME